MLICKAGLEGANNSKLLQTSASFKLNSGTEFAKLVNAANSTEVVMQIMDELMVVLQSTNPSLYAGVLRKIKEAS